MFTKMLLTLACVIGVSGCGPLEKPLEWVFLREPLPPVLHPVAGVRIVRVTVENLAPTHKLVATNVDDGIVREMNIFANGIKAIAVGDKSVADGILAVSIIEERGVFVLNKRHSDSLTWRFRVRFSASLMRSNGQTIWRNDAQSVSYEIGFSGHDRPSHSPDWSMREVPQQLTTMLGARIVEDLVHVK